MGDYLRGTGARSALSGICREIGYPPDHELMQMLRARAKVRQAPKALRPAPPVHGNDEPHDDDAA
jgi:hypothetical protein